MNKWNDKSVFLSLCLSINQSRFSKAVFVLCHCQALGMKWTLFKSQQSPGAGSIMSPIVQMRTLSCTRESATCPRSRRYHVTEAEFGCRPADTGAWLHIAGLVHCPVHGGRIGWDEVNVRAARQTNVPQKTVIACPSDIASVSVLCAEGSDAWLSPGRQDSHQKLCHNTEAGGISAEGQGENKLLPAVERFHGGCAS